mmetsp:Transcript_20122/g.47083  ORF Transcript_20122/g.47083 Transcript_20122/m.47083 type:complete len:237 (+) Transcript_20122:1068-1778(+)
MLDGEKPEPEVDHQCPLGVESSAQQEAAAVPNDSVPVTGRVLVEVVPWGGIHGPVAYAKDIPEHIPAATATVTALVIHVLFVVRIIANHQAPRDDDCVGRGSRVSPWVHTEVPEFPAKPNSSGLHIGSPRVHQTRKVSDSKANAARGYRSGAFGRFIGGPALCGLAYTVAAAAAADAGGLESPSSVSSSETFNLFLGGWSVCSPSSASSYASCNGREISSEYSSLSSSSSSSSSSS